MAAFKPGAAALCISRDVPCVPVGIVGASEAMPYGKNWPERGRPPIWVVFGEPLRPEDGETRRSSPTGSRRKSAGCTTRPLPTAQNIHNRQRPSSKEK